MNLKHATISAACVALVGAGLAVPDAASGQQDDVTFLLVGKGGTLPAGLAKKVDEAGGDLTAAYPFGVATVQAPASFAGVPGTTAIVDHGFTVDSGPTVEVDADQLPPASGDDDELFDLQWGHVPVRAVEAWEDGVTGEGARVAVLDTGFDLDHPDLAPNINTELSADFTGEGLQYTLDDTFSHGTHVAGTIAAADNGLGTIGVALDAELVLVKVLEDAGSGSFEDVFAGIYHAAGVADADVINMSLGDVQPRSEEGITQLAVAMNKAVTYAHQQGTAVVVSAGNDAHDLDGDGNLVRFLTSASHAIGISAAAPTGWAVDPAGADYSIPASYTNYGTSMVDFSAPGGDSAYPGDESCTVAELLRPCWVFDLVFSTGNNGYYWSAGTSMAAPHAAGVAALIISEHGGELKPSHVEREMRQRAVDYGKPGTDDYHGRGFVTSGH